jgi:uncharacterized protein (TIGR03435 family)
MRTFLAIAFFIGSTIAQVPARVTFDVTSVRPTPPGRLYQLKFEKCTNGGPFIASGNPVQWIINYAYGVDDRQVIGGPAWLNSFDVAYDIEGKPDHGVSAAECRAMVQSLLEDRFKLRVHHELRQVAAYALVVGKNRPRLEPAKPVEAGGGVFINGALQQQLSEQEAPGGWSMGQLAGVVSSFAGRTVVDRTNLSGTYSFHIRFAHTEDSNDPDVATALSEQLGLKLEPIKTDIDTIVIDHVERPDAN